MHTSKSEREAHDIRVARIVLVVERLALDCLVDRVDWLLVRLAIGDLHARHKRAHNELEATIHTTRHTLAAIMGERCIERRYLPSFI